MRRHARTTLGLVLGLAVLSGCGSSSSTRVALLSDGRLEGKSFAATPAGPVLEGEDCGFYHNLSNAFRNAVQGTGYDTLVNVEVTTTSAALVPSNCIAVRGTGLKSSQLQHAGALE